MSGPDFLRAGAGSAEIGLPRALSLRFWFTLWEPMRCWMQLCSPVCAKRGLWSCSLSVLRPGIGAWRWAMHRSTFLKESKVRGFYLLFLFNNFFLGQKQHHTAHPKPDTASHFRSPKARGSDFIGETQTMGTSDETERKTWGQGTSDVCTSLLWCFLSCTGNEGTHP